MTASLPRVNVPSSATRGEIFVVRSLITHPMETGLRKDEQGELIPRKIINSFTCRYNGEIVFKTELHEAVAANPYIEFHVRALESGTLDYVWEEDGGAVFTLQSALTVT
jgi:sulfur-oxidizing protein SoxZ